MTEIDAAERVRLLVEEFEARGARYVNPGCVDEGLAVADVRAVLLELRRLRALAVDPANTWLVTVKLPKNPKHNPHAKQTGQCPFSNECTDVTGEHQYGARTLTSRTTSSECGTPSGGSGSGSS